VSATVLTRPAEDAGEGGRPARRAVVRWGWRLLRHEWRQQLLVLALVTVAVAGTVLGAAVVTNTPTPANAGFGSADHLATLPAGPAAAADLAALRRAFGTVDVIENAQLATGLAQGTQLRAQDPAGAFGRPMLAVLTGRLPAAGEVAMTRDLAATFGVAVGDRWQHAGRAYRVVGLVENPLNLLDSFALLAPGQLAMPAVDTVLFDASEPALTGFRAPPGVTVVAPRRPGGIPPEVVVLAAAIVGLMFVGLVAAAGFTVLAQRRLRALGMLSSLGATDRHIRLVLITNGAAVGVVGAVAGAAIGLAVWIGYAPQLSGSVHHRVSWTQVPWWLVVAAMLLAVATATLAARRPARAAARVPVVAALSRRPAPPPAVHRSAVPGLICIVAGTSLLALSGGWGSNGGKNAVFQLSGLLASGAGLLLLAPFGVALLGMSARRAPVSVRIALRDLARYRARSGSALAAASFAVYIAALIALIATGRFADPFDYFGPNLRADQLVVYAQGSGPDGGTAVQPGPKGSPAPPAAREDPAALATSIAGELGTRDLLALQTTDALLVRPVARAGDDGFFSAHGAVYVATPGLLARYGIDPGSIDPATVVLSSRPGLDRLRDLRLTYGPDQSPRLLAGPKIQLTDRLPAETSAPNLLVTESAVRRLGLQVTPAAWLLQAPRPLTALQINVARQAAVAAGLTIEVRSDAPSLDQVRDDATIVGILVALGVLAMTVGLVRAETGRELQTLTATGASGRHRRTLTAATAGALGLLAAVLGTAVAYLATLAFFRPELAQRMSHTPVLDLLLILIGLPVAAAAGGWLFAGRQPPAIAHQPLE
jgi:putative ABC transport system permease protein